MTPDPAPAAVPPTPAEPGTRRARPTRRGPVRQVLEVVGVLVSFAAAGLGAGWLWEHWWTPTTGLVIGGSWNSGVRGDATYLANDMPTQAHYFDAVATFVLIGLVAGLVLGVGWALLGRCSELVMLAAVVVGSALACLIAYRLGVHLGPPDPAPLAKAADDYTILPADLSLPGKSPFVGWTLGALIGLCATYFVTSGVAESTRREDENPDWLSRAG